MDDKEFEEIKKDWTDDRIAYLTMQLLQTRPVSIIQQLIAYVDELREKIVVRDAELEYTHNSIDKMYAESIEFSKRSVQLQEENEKLKEAQGKLQFFFHEADRNDILQLKLRQAKEENANAEKEKVQW